MQDGVRELPPGCLFPDPYAEPGGEAGGVGDPVRIGGRVEVDEPEPAALDAAEGDPGEEEEREPDEHEGEDDEEEQDQEGGRAGDHPGGEIAG